MNESLDSFLGSAPGQPQNAAPEPPVADTPSPERAAPELPETPSAPEPGPTASAPVAHQDDDDALPVSGGTVPLHALQAERNKRNDYKAQVIRQDEQLKALQSQLEELKKAPPPVQVVPAAVAPAPAPAPQPAIEPEPPAPMPNPAEDPEGYARWHDQRQAFAAFNLRLETTEDLLREKEGDEAVDKAVAAFKAMVAAEEGQFGRGRSPLGQGLTVQRNPYRWMFTQVRKAEADKEIGGDLDAWKTKQRDAIRAEIEAEAAAKAAAALDAAPILVAAPAPREPAAPVNLPRSLANATSAAPRSSVAWTGPTPLSDIVPRR